MKLAVQSGDGAFAAEGFVHKNRIDQAVRRQARFPAHTADSVVLPQTAWAVDQVHNNQILSKKAGAALARPPLLYMENGIYQRVYVGSFGHNNRNTMTFGLGSGLLANTDARNPGEVACTH